MAPSTPARRILLLLPMVGLLFAGACHREDKTRTKAAAVVRCERGVERAVAQETLDAVTRVYHEECAGVHAEASCRQAFLDAARAAPENQLSLTAEGCRKAYCSILGAEKFEICREGFRATPESLLRAWPPFHGAILQHDTGAMRDRLTNALLRLYVRQKALEKEAAAAAARPSQEKAADGGPVPSATDAPPATSGVPPSGSSASPPKPKTK